MELHFKINREERYTLTTLTELLNKVGKKEGTDKEFSVSDVQQYIRRECLPSYLTIDSKKIYIKKDESIRGTKLYYLELEKDVQE